MANQSSTIVQRVWNYCNVLRDDGMSYGDYVEQLTYLLFLKMDYENVKQLGKESAIPADYDWSSMQGKSGEDLEKQYREILDKLGQGAGLIPVIFRKAQNKIQDPAKLERLVQLIDGETWIGMDIDIKGEIYEGLLEKNAQDTKSGAGQYFTPRPLIKAIVDVMSPQPGVTICDPACGTGGFLLAAHDFIARNNPLDREQWGHLNHQALHGWEIVDNTARLCVMNLYLHGIGANGGKSPIHVSDSLAAHPGEYFDMVLTNPPFGKKSSVTFVTEEGEIRTSNKQLNFVQHVRSILTQHGDVHTLLRLPTGVFYAQGVKANVLFFDRKPASETPWTKKLWIYDLRTNQHFTLIRDPLTREDLDEFVECYNPSNRQEREETWSEDNPDGRWRVYDYDALMARDKLSLDIFWIQDDSLMDMDNLPEPDVIARDIVEELRAALEQFEGILEDLEPTGDEKM